MVFWPPYPCYIEPPINGILNRYPWYYTHLPMVFWPPTHVILTHLSMVFWTATHGIIPTCPWYFEPRTHCILTPYPWYFDPLPSSWLEMRGVKIPWGSVFNKGGQNTIWHRSFLHFWPITGFVIRLTRRVPLVEQEQLTFPEHPSSAPVFSGVCYTIFSFMCMFCRSLFVLLSFFAIVLSVLRFTHSYYPFGFGILKLFLRKVVIHFPIGSYVKNCHVSGS